MTGVSPGLAQNVEQVKPVFEHIIPNAEGKRMVAVVVTYPPGAKSPAHHHARSAFSHPLVQRSPTLLRARPATRKRVFTFGPTFVTLRQWKRTLSASHSGPMPRRAKSDFLFSCRFEAVL